MHGLKANFDKILMITNQALSDKLDADGCGRQLTGVSKKAKTF